MALPEATSVKTQPPRYWAFLSYSQRDKQWSDWLRRSIENYRVPRRLVGRQARDGTVPRRLFPVFRDREELPTSANLGSNIEEALRASRYLIVVCSPNGAASRWVNEEIRAFKAMGREDRVLAVIVDGEPNASDQPDSGVPECFPKAIRYRIGADGELTQERTEPIAADVRRDKDGRDNARLKILAGLLGVGFDELRQRDRARRRRRIILATAAAAAIITALAGIWFLQERAKKRDVDRQLASKYEERARALAAKGDEASAALFFAEANHLDSSRVRRDAALLHLQWLVLPELTVEHGEEITCVAFDPEGRRFLTMDRGRLADTAEKTIPAKARLWDRNSGKQLVEFSVDSQSYIFSRRAFFTHDGKRIFTVLENARLWDAESGKPIGPPIPFNAIQLGGGESSHVDRVGLDPTEKKVVLKWDQNFTQSWDAETSQPLDKVEYRPGEWPDLAFLWRDDPVPKFSPDATIALRQSDYGPIQLIEVESGKEMGEPLRQQVDISAAAVSPKNDLVATGGSDGVVYLWRINGRSEAVRAFSPMLHPGVISRVIFSPDGEFILTSSGATAYLWNRVGQLEMVMPSTAEIEAVTFSANGQRILTGDKNGTAMIWNVAERRMLPKAIAHRAWERARVMALSPDGRSLFTQAPSESGHAQIQLWDVRRAAPLWNEVEHAPAITLVVFSPDGSTIATVDREDATEKKMVRLGNAKTGSAIGDPVEITGRSGGDSETPDTVMAFSADSSRLLLVHNEFLPPAQPGGGLTAQAKLHLLDGRTGQRSREPLLVDEHVTGAIFLRSGDVLLAHKRDGVVNWPAGQSEPSKEQVVKIKRVLSIAVSPDEKTLLTVARDEARLWDLKSRQPIGAPLQVFDLVDFAPRKKSGLTQIHNAAFSPDGRIAITTAGREVRLWEARTGDSVGQPFPLGDFPMFGQTPRFIDGGHLLAPGRGVVWDKELSWLLRNATPEQILLEAQVFSRRQMRADGSPEIISATDWKAKRALWSGR